MLEEEITQCAGVLVRDFLAAAARAPADHATSLERVQRRPLPVLPARCRRHGRSRRDDGGCATGAAPGAAGRHQRTASDPAHIDARDHP
jgi:hypothetical protein